MRVPRGYTRGTCRVDVRGRCYGEWTVHCRSVVVMTHHRVAILDAHRLRWVTHRRQPLAVLLLERQSVDTRKASIVLLCIRADLRERFRMGRLMSDLSACRVTSDLNLERVLIGNGYRW